MDTTLKNLHFIILIPHRDALKSFNDYRQKLFSIGIEGAFSFPLSIPLAEVSRPFSRPELKELAEKIRKLTMSNNGKIVGGENTLAQCPGKLSFYGPVLNLLIKDDTFPQTAKGKLLRALFPPVLCAALFKTALVPELTKSIETPPLLFGAASLANLGVRSLASGERDYSFEWKTSPLVWLPKATHSSYISVHTFHR